MIQTEPDTSDYAVRLRQIRFRWPGDVDYVLDIEAFAVAAGERVFVMGASGSGKTTLLSLLGGLIVPQSGSVDVMGTDLAQLPGGPRDAFRADFLGFIFQMFNIVPYLSPVENVLLPCRFSRARRDRAIERSGSIETEASRLLDRMGLDMRTREGRSAVRLSVGQQQRVAAARALIGAPGLVIADEPTSALDADARRSFLDLLFGEVARNGASLLFVSHDASLSDSFDRVVAMSDINRPSG